MYFSEADKWLREIEDIDYILKPEASSVFLKPKKVSLSDAFFMVLSDYRRQRMRYKAALRYYRFTYKELETAKPTELTPTSSEQATGIFPGDIVKLVREGPQTRFEEAMKLLNQINDSKLKAARNFLTLIERALASGMLTEGEGLRPKA